MKKIKYPDITEHIHRHQELIDIIEIYKTKLDKKENINLLEISSFLSNWIIEHISTEDCTGSA